MNTLDAVLLWLRSTAARLRELGRKLTRSELWLLGYMAMWIGIGLGSLVLAPSWKAGGEAAAVTLGTLMFVCPVIADAVIQRDNLKQAGAALIRTNATKPTGAPRVAEVTCKHGDEHRFVYGPTGWEPAGPAVERRQEVPAP